ncbi:hypothetical protein NLI96_g1821 [Meripilus lineatus]|uniref:Uncharacterized protein n=1 Tax=Meripilus lineatus TaxID=2056292 RepID=A0AAD5VBX0_9APHY|nr:hypothetical protein NLI96_g1821 [Physisporinus lineatus]
MYGFGLGSMQQKWQANPDERWKDWVIIGAGSVSLVVGVIMPLLWPMQGLTSHSHMAASANLAQARLEAREYGAERRQEIRKRVQEHKEVQKDEELGHCDDQTDTNRK